MITDHKILIDGLNICYSTAGSPKNPPLIFLHGWGARKGNIFGKGRANVILTLSKYFHVVAPELPGLIRSEPPHEAWGMEEYARFVHAFLDYIGVRNPIVMGQSFGGGIATHYAHLFPNNTSSLILIDAVPSNRQENWYRNICLKFQSIWDYVVKSKYMPLIAKKCLISLWLGVPWGHITKQNFIKYMIMGDVIRKQKVSVDYKTFAMPVLMIWGERDVHITPISRAKEIHGEIKNSTLAVIKSAGHLALYTHTKKVITEIISFHNLINKSHE